MNNHALWRCTILLAVLSLLSACGSSVSSATQTAPGSLDAKAKTYQDIVVGFAQIGAESEWRTANTRSIEQTAHDLGVELKLSDAQQQQDNQIKAIRSFIAQRVDVIGVSPVVEKGWDAVFAEVKQAGIPLILIDRHADVPDNLFDAFIGSDFVQEGQRACAEASAPGASPSSPAGRSTANSAARCAMWSGPRWSSPSLPRPDAARTAGPRHRPAGRTFPAHPE